MNRFEEFQARINDQGKSVFDYTIDWLEWSARKNLAIADDVAEFTVLQLRLPIEADGLADYRNHLGESYGEFGETLKRHGDDYVTRLKEIPAEVREIFAPKKVTKKAASKKAGGTKAAAKKKTKARTAKAA